MMDFDENSENRLPTAVAKGKTVTTTVAPRPQRRPLGQIPVNSLSETSRPPEKRAAGVAATRVSGMVSIAFLFVFILFSFCSILCTAHLFKPCPFLSSTIHLRRSQGVRVHEVQSVTFEAD